MSIADKILRKALQRFPTGWAKNVVGKNTNLISRRK